MPTLSSLPIALNALPAGDTLACTFTCTDRDGAVDLTGAVSVEFGIWQGVIANDSTPPLAFASVADGGITISGAGDNVANVVCQTTGMRAGVYFYRMRVVLTSTNVITFAKGQITLI